MSANFAHKAVYWYMWRKRKYMIPFQINDCYLEIK
jgi:hypothetical protein